MILRVFQNHFTLVALLAAGMMFAPAMAQAHERDRGFRHDAFERQTCRDYTRTIFEFGRLRVAYGTACLQRDGSWRVVAEGPRPIYRLDQRRVRYVIPGYRYPGGFIHNDRRHDRHDRHDDRRDRHERHDRD